GAGFLPAQARLPAGAVDSGHAAAIFNCRLPLRLLCAPVLPGARARGRAPSVRARARLSGPAGGRAVGGSAPSAALAGAAAARGSGNRAAGTEDGTAEPPRRSAGDDRSAAVLGALLLAAPDRAGGARCGRVSRDLAAPAGRGGAGTGSGAVSSEARALVCHRAPRRWGQAARARSRLCRGRDADLSADHESFRAMTIRKAARRRRGGASAGQVSSAPRTRPKSGSLWSCGSGVSTRTPRTPSTVTPGGRYRLTSPSVSKRVKTASSRVRSLMGRGGRSRRTR